MHLLCWMSRELEYNIPADLARRLLMPRRSSTLSPCSLSAPSLSSSPAPLSFCLSVSVSSSCDYHDTLSSVVQMDEHRSSLLCVFVHLLPHVWVEEHVCSSISVYVCVSSPKLCAYRPMCVSICLRWVEIRLNNRAACVSDKLENLLLQ